MALTVIMRSFEKISFALGLTALVVCGQAPKQLLEALPPTSKAVTIEYVNPFDQSKSEALVELPGRLDRPLPLIVTPHGANWTQEMNRSLWSGVCEQFHAIIVYPRHQGKFNPRVSLGSARQMANLTAAVEEVKRRYKVDTRRIYAGGISQGAIETLLLLGHDPEKFAGGIAMNPIPDMLAFYADTAPGEAEKTANEPLRKLRMAQWPALHKLLEADLGGTPDTARAEYYRRSAVIYARQLASVRLILYWSDNDELIPKGQQHQGGVLADLIRTFHPKAFQEVKHTGGHGYPFYRVDLSKMQVEIFPRDIFLNSVKQMLGTPAGGGRRSNANTGRD